MAGADLWRVKPAKWKEQKVEKKEAMSAIQSHKKLIHFFLVPNYNFSTTFLWFKHIKNAVKWKFLILAILNQAILTQIYPNLIGLESNKDTQLLRSQETTYVSRIKVFRSSFWNRFILGSWMVWPADRGDRLMFLTWNKH